MYDTAKPLEPGQLLVTGVEVVAFLDETGVQRYRVRCDRDAELSTLLGLLEMAKQDLIGTSTWRPAGWGEDR